MHYNYVCYGLKTVSEIPLRGIDQCASTKCLETIKINFGSVPKTLVRPSKSRAAFEVAENRVLLRPQDAAPIIVSDGNDITVEHSPYSCYLNQKSYILGSAFGAILQQRGDLVLHACSVTQGNEAIIICGKSGRGKSSTLFELLSRGFSYASDDVSRISFKDRSVIVYPSYPEVRLWDSSLERYPLTSISKNLVKESGAEKKYALKQDANFNNQISKVRAIVHLSYEPSAKPVLNRVYGKDVFSILRNNIYRKAFLTGSCLIKNIALIENFSKCVPTFQLKRPNTGNSIVEVANLIGSLFEK